MKTKIIVVTGGVYSSLGKGIVASSIGCILKHGNFSIAMLKLDPYLNTDPGLLNPLQHGEVFLTDDGQKTDLDLGHYERFTGLNLTKHSTQTGGKLYREIFEDEMQNKYHGATIQIIPHLTNKIIEKIKLAIKAYHQPDFLIIEIGGTAGDIESLAFMEAVRLYHTSYKNVMFVHCSPLFQLSANDEIKTKPTQQSVKILRNLGINPNMLILRFKDLISQEDKEKLSWTCDVDKNNIFVSKDCKYLYEVPKILFEQGIHKSILKFFKMKNVPFDMGDWNSFLDSIYANRTQQVHICICGKYTELNDSYLSLIESLKITCYKAQLDLKLTLLNTSEIPHKNLNKTLDKFDGFIVPDGSSDEATLDSLINVVDYCMQSHKPYFGIKLGMQVMVEWYLKKHQLTNHRLIQKLPLDEESLGSCKVILNPSSKIFNYYQQMMIYERHANQWVLNPLIVEETKEMFTMVAFNEFNHLEALESNDAHTFMLGVMWHPEYISKPNNPHPLFVKFIKACIK